MGKEFKLFGVLYRTLRNRGVEFQNEESVDLFTPNLSDEVVDNSTPNMHVRMVLLMVFSRIHESQREAGERSPHRAAPHGEDAVSDRKAEPSRQHSGEQTARSGGNGEPRIGIG